MKNTNYPLTWFCMVIILAGISSPTAAQETLPSSESSHYSDTRIETIKSVLIDMRSDAGERLNTFGIKRIESVDGKLFLVDVCVDQSLQHEQINWFRNAFQKVSKPDEYLVIEKIMTFPFQDFLTELQQKIDVVSSKKFRNVLITSVNIDLDVSTLIVRGMFDSTAPNLQSDIKKEVGQLLKYYPTIHEHFKTVDQSIGETPSKNTTRARKLKFEALREFFKGQVNEAERLLAHSMYESPDDIETNFLRAMCFISQGRKKLAEKTLIELHRRLVENGVVSIGESPTSYEPAWFLNRIQGSIRSDLIQTMRNVDLALARGAIENTTPVRNRYSSARHARNHNRLLTIGSVPDCGLELGESDGTLDYTKVTQPFDISFKMEPPKNETIPSDLPN